VIHPFRHLPIRRKISGLLLLTTVSALLLAFTASIFLSYRFERSELARELDTLAKIVAENSAGALLFEDAQTSRATLASLRANPSIVGAAIYSIGGVPFATYGTIPAGELRSGSPGRRDIVTTSRAIELNGDKLGTLYLASDLRDLDNALSVQITTGVAVLITAVLLALLMTAGLQRLVTRPFMALAAAAQSVTREKDYGVRVEVSELQEGDELHRVMQAFNEMLAQIQCRDETLRLHQADLERQVEARTAELRNANEDLQDAMQLAKRAADESAILSRHNQMILNAAGEGIFGLDVNGTLTFMNPSAARILRCNKDMLTGTNLHARIHFHDESDAGPRTVSECPICRADLDVPVRAGRDAVFRGCDSRRVPVDYTSSTMMDEKGQATGVVVTFRDITERLAMEKMKGEFVSTVSHELRTPLTAIRGALGLLGSGLLGSATPKGQRMLEIALVNIDRLGRLINDILDLEKMSAGRVELNRKVFAARALVEEAVEDVLPIADRAGVTIIADVAAAQLFADADRILQALLNLLSNAIKFSPRDTVIRVTGEVKQNQYVFSVSDHGRGVPADKLEMIFQRFTQVDASDSRDKGGTGLGLAICRAIIDAHGGKIWAERAEPAGSVFTFTIPLKLPAEVESIALAS
jgi:PAS domain S-box-containing protein